MKNKLLNAALLSAAAVLFGVQTICCAVDFVPDGEKYTISGNAGEVKSHMLSVDVSGGGICAHTSYILTDDDGNFSYGFMLSEGAAAGRYTLKLTDGVRGEVYTHEFVYADDEKKAQLIAGLNSAAERQTASAALEECVEFSMYAYPSSFVLTEEMLNSVCDAVAAANDFTEDNLTDKLKEIFAAASLMYASEENLDKILTEYRQIYRFEDEKYYGMYIGFDDTDAVNRMFMKNKLDNLSQIRQVFNEIVVLHKMSGEESPGGIANIIAECADVFPSSVTSLSKDEKLKLGTILLGKSINTMKEIETAAADMKNNSGGGQGGAAGGQGGSGGGAGKNSSKASGGSGFAGGAAVSSDTESGKRCVYEFADLKDAEWAREAVYALTDKAVISGYEDGDFKPNNYITREEFVKIIVCAFKLNTAATGSGFDDVPPGHWAEAYISAASGSGIVGGIGSGRFGPEQNITRQDMAVIIYRALEVSGKARAFEAGSSFADAEDIAEYAANAVNALKAYEITAGYTDGTFLPQNSATRAEASQLIYKVMQFAEMI